MTAAHPRTLQIALKTRRFDLAAHAIVYAMLKVKTDDLLEERKNGKEEGAPAGEPER